MTRDRLGQWARRAFEVTQQRCRTVSELVRGAVGELALVVLGDEPFDERQYERQVLAYLGCKVNEGSAAEIDGSAA